VPTRIRRPRDETITKGRGGAAGRYPGRTGLTRDSAYANSGCRMAAVVALGCHAQTCLRRVSFAQEWIKAGTLKLRLGVAPGAPSEPGT